MKKQMLIIVVSLAVASAAVTATDKAASPGQQQQPEPVKMNAQQIFSFVENVLKNPKADRSKAEAFLQRVLDGKLHQKMVGISKSDSTDTECLGGYDCQGKKCMECDEKDRCWCSNCCIGGTQ